MHAIFAVDADTAGRETSATPASAALIVGIFAPIQPHSDETRADSKDLRANGT